MRGGAGGLETPAMVDRDIDEHGSGAHGAEHGARDQPGSKCARYQRRADHRALKHAEARNDRAGRRAKRRAAKRRG